VPALRTTQSGCPSALKSATRAVATLGVGVGVGVAEGLGVAVGMGVGVGVAFDTVTVPTILQHAPCGVQ
jgi:hypothetical protein